MVRLAARSFLHLTPELVSSGFDHPFYAKVVRVDEDTITFRSLEGGTGTVSREVANQHVVTAREVNKAGELSLLRRSMSVQANGVIQYGQVIATDGDTMTIDTDGNQVIALACDVSHVPPIVALMLQHAHFSCDEWNGSDLEHLQSSILDRILGQHGEVPTNEVANICDGLMSADSVPQETKVCSWIDPQTGESTEFQLQHAIHFAFFVDGGQHPVPDSVGQSFCQPPDQGLEQERIGGTGSSTNEGLELFDPFVDDDEDQLDHSEHETTGMSASIRVPTRQNKRPATIDQSINFDSVQQHSQKRRRMESSAALDKDAMIIERLGDDPELLDRFQSIRQGTNSLLSKTNDTSETKAAALTTSRKKSDPTSKYSRLDQEYVHDQVTSEKHKGKTPSVFVNSMVRSEAVNVKAVPGVCIRAYDIRFGSKGLSIRHFARISQDERVTWLEAGGSNFDNLSATAEFGKAPPATTIEDVVDATRVFLTYAQEYCCTALVNLTEEILRFLEMTLKRVTWTPSELPYVVYWVNDVLEDFRDAIAAGSDITQVRERCTTDDHLLRDLMFVKLHRQVDQLKLKSEGAASCSKEQSRPSAHIRHPRQDNQTIIKIRHGRMPKNVLKRLPTQIDPVSGQRRALCMRFLSNVGCVGDDNDCPSD